MMLTRCKVKILYTSTMLLFLLLACSNRSNPQEVTEDVSEIAVEKRSVQSVKKEAPKKQSKDAIYLESYGLVCVDSLDTEIKVELKYATTDNFTKTVLYTDLTEAYLHPIAAQKLLKAQQLLRSVNPQYSLLIYDAARPMSIQRKMYEVVQNTKYHAYVANPARTGLHNYGMAVDLTICDENGSPLDMGTDFDFFGKAAGINQEEKLKMQGVLSQYQIDNRKLLRKVMVDAGFYTIRGEWWHFNALPLSEVKKTIKLIE